MRNSLRAFALCLSLAHTAAGQQPIVRQQLVVPLAGSGFVGFRLETKLEAAQGADDSQNFAAVQAALLPQALLGEHNTIHRVVLNREGNPVFGYDLVVEPIADSKKFRVTAQPLSAEFDRALRARRAGASSSATNVPTLARAAETQTLEDGDAVSLDLLVNPRTGVRVVDVIKVAYERARLWQSAPRDFTLDSVEIALRDQRLTMNGEPLAVVRAAREVSGALVWFYVPGRGRFILSLVPRAGYDFRKIALIEDNHVSFDFRGDHFEWVSSAPVVGNGGDWYAWVLADASYTPEVNSAEEIAHDADKKPGDASPLKQALDGKTPQPPRAGFDNKSAGGTTARAGQPLRARTGASDRMENLLPKK